MKRKDQQPGDNALAMGVMFIVLIMFGLFMMIWPTIERALNTAVLK